MAEADRDKMLRDMAANRHCRLVKSRRRTPGIGDYGRYGLKDAATGAEVFGFAGDGLTATPDEIEAYLRKGLVSDWKSSLAAAEPAGEERHDRKSPDPGATPVRRRRGERETPGRAPPPAPPPPPRRTPRLRIVEAAAAPAPPPPAPPPPPPAPQPRPILKIREARPADAEQLDALLAESRGTIAKRLGAQRKAGEPPLVADEGGKILGCAAWHAIPMLHEPAPLGRITLLLVAPQARRRGIGRALVEEIEARLADAGCQRIEALAEIELAAAPDFFRRLGWSRSAYRYARNLAAQA